MVKGLGVVDRYLSLGLVRSIEAVERSCLAHCS